jgi:hypothetical protein
MHRSEIGCSRAQVLLAAPRELLPFSVLIPGSVRRWAEVLAAGSRRGGIEPDRRRPPIQSSFAPRRGRLMHDRDGTPGLDQQVAGQGQRLPAESVLDMNISECAFVRVACAPGSSIVTSPKIHRRPERAAHLAAEVSQADDPQCSCAS